MQEQFLEGTFCDCTIRVTFPIEEEEPATKKARTKKGKGKGKGKKEVTTANL